MPRKPSPPTLVGGPYSAPRCEPGAVLLMFAFTPGRRGPAPRGIDPARIPALFSQWDLTFRRPASEVPLRGPMRNATPSWYQLVRR